MRAPRRATSAGRAGHARRRARALRGLAPRVTAPTADRERAREVGRRVRLAEREAPRLRLARARGPSAPLCCASSRLFCSQCIVRVQRVPGGGRARDRARRLQLPPPLVCHRHEPAVSVAVTPAGSGTGWYGGSDGSAVARGVGGAAVAGRRPCRRNRGPVVVDVLGRGGRRGRRRRGRRRGAGATVVEDVSVAAALSSDFPGVRRRRFEPAANTSPAPIAIDAERRSRCR